MTSDDMGAAPPAGRGSFVGRLREMRALESSVQQERLITVCGAPGIGKTRLVVEWGMRAPQPIGWCDLSEARDHGDVVFHVARTLGARVHLPDDRATAQLGAILRAHGPCVLVLDNVEHVADAVRSAIATWLDAAPALRILCTSRHRLGLSGEVVAELGPLSLPTSASGIEESEACRLLIDRTRAVRADFRVSAGAAAIAELATQLDGIPLAIELAAARLRVLDPEELLRRLEEHRLSLLGRHAGLEGQRYAALATALDDSWSLLDRSEQQTLAQCAVFCGGFSLEAAEAVVDPGSTNVLVVDVLQRLRDKSLVVGESVAGELRFRLYASIRHYADRRLGSERSRVAERHGRYFLGAAERRLRSPRGEYGPPTRWLGRERDNVYAAFGHFVATRDARAAGRTALALLALLPVEGTIAFYRSLLDRAIEALAEIEDTQLSAQLHLARGDVLRLSGRGAASRRDLEHAATVAESLDDPGLAAGVSLAIGVRHRARGRFADARRSYERALDGYLRADEPAGAAGARRRLGELHALRRDFAHAMEYYEEALRGFREIGDGRRQVFVLYGMGLIAVEKGAVRRVERLAAELATLGRRTSDRRASCLAHGLRAAVEQECGHLETAARRYERALRSFRRAGDRVGERHGLRFLAGCYHEAGRLDEAWATCAEALELHRELEDRLGAAYVAAGMVGLAVDRGDEARATRLYARVARDAADVDDGVVSRIIAVQEGHLLRARARDARRRGAVHDARRHLDDARRLRDLASAGQPGFDLRLALRLLDRALADESAHLTAGSVDASSRGLVVGPGGTWFELPDLGRVALRGRGAIRRILEALAQQRAKAPGDAVSRAQLVAAGWPGERPIERAARSRVHTAVWTLRKLGLRELVVRSGSGYLLDPAVPFSRAQAAEFENV